MKFFQTVKANQSEQYNVVMEVKMENEKGIKGLIDLVLKEKKNVNNKNFYQFPNILFIYIQ